MGISYFVAYVSVSIVPGVHYFTRGLSLNRVRVCNCSFGAADLIPSAPSVVGIWLILDAPLFFSSDEVRSARMGFQESNAAHQRTAERSHVFEQELYKTRQTVDSLRTEAAALREQVQF